MASKKQLAWRKKFAKMSKAGKFKKSKKKSTKSKRQIADKSLTAICGICDKTINKSEYYEHTSTHFNNNETERTRPETGDW